MKSIDDLVLGTGSIDTNQSEQPKMSSIDDLVLGVKSQEQAINVDIPDQTIPSHLMADKVSEQPSELPSLSSTNPYSNKIVDESGVGQDNLSIPQSNEPTFMSQFWDAFSKTGQDLKGLVTKDGVPNITELNRGVAQFGLAIPGFITGAVNGSARAVEELVKQQGEILGDSLNFTKPPKQMNLDKIVDAFSTGMEEANKFFQPGVETLTGKPTESSELVGKVAMAPFETINYLGNQLAKSKMLEDSPNIRGAIRILSNVAGLAVNGALMDPNHVFSSKVEERNVKSFRDIVDAVKPLESEILDTVNTGHAAEGLDGVQKVAAEKIFEIKKKQTEINIQNALDRLSKSKYVDEDLAWTEEQAARNRTFPVQDSGLGLKRPGKKAIESVTQEIGPSSTVQPDRSNIKQTEESTNAVQEQSTTGVGAHEGGDQSTGRSGESQGVGQGKQGKEVAKESEEGKVVPNPTPGPLVGKGENFKIEQGKSWTEFEVDGDRVIVHDVLVDKTDRRKGIASQFLQQIEQAYPDKEVWIGSTNRAMNKVAENNGYELVSKKGEYVEGKAPEQVNDKNMSAYVKRKGGDLNGLQEEGKTEGEVIPHEPIPPSEKTPRRKKVSVRDKNSNELKDYYTPGNIVKTYYGHDKVLDYSVDEKGNFVVTSQAVIKDANGNWIVDPKNGEVRTHSTSPSEKELKKGPVEKVSGKPSTPPLPETISYHGTSSYFIDHNNLPTELTPISLKDMVNKVLNDLGLKGKSRNDAKKLIHNEDYFASSINKLDRTRPFDKAEVYHTGDINSAKEYAQFSGESYHAALRVIANSNIDSKIVNRAKELINKIDNATPYIIELEANGNKKGDNISDNPLKIKRVLDINGEPISKVPPPEPINSVDKVTGTEPVENTRTDGTYFTDKEETLKLSKLYEENAKKVKGNVELALGKLINDVNLWLHGEGNIDIGVTRKIIDRFATDKNFRQMFDTEAEFVNFQENAREVATWASRADRSKIERSGGLNFMIPLDRIPEALKSIAEEIVKRTGTLVRNKELWEKTGLVWNRDKKKWEYEYNNPNMKIKQEGIDELKKGNTVNIKDIIDDQELFKIHKNVNDIGVYTTGGKDAWYNNEQNLIEIGREELKNLNNIKDILSHEIQHVIQDSLNGSKGGNPNSISLSEYNPEYIKIMDNLQNKINRITQHRKYKELTDEYLNNMDNAVRTRSPKQPIRDSYKQNKIIKIIERLSDKYTEVDNIGRLSAYKQLTGEMQSRLTELRQNMTPEQRLAEAPWETLDKMLAKEKLPVGVGYKLYSDPFGIQIVYDFLKDKFFTNKTGSRRNNIDWSKIKNDEVKGALDKAIGFAESMDKDRRFSEGDIKGKLKEGFYTTYEAFLDTKVRAEMELRMASKSKNPELRKAAEESLIKMVNESGGHSAGQVNFELFNDKVFGGLNKSDINILNTLIRGKRVQDIANYRPKAKFPKGQDFEAAVYYDAFHQMIEGIDEVKSKDLLSRREAYFNGMKELVDLLVEHGILDEEAGNRLKSHDYSMFKGIGQRIDRGEGVEVESLFDERVPSRVGGKLQSVQSSGIERLAHGKSSDILEPDQRITALEMYNRVYGRIFRNDTFKSLAEVAKAQPDNGFIRLTDKAEEAAIANAKDRGIAVDNLPAKDKRGWIKHYYWEDGKKHVMWLSTDFADAMGSMGRDLSPRAVAWVKLASFAGVKRAMLTGLSPLWSTFVNFTADQLTVFLTNHTYENGVRKRLYSTNPVISSLQMGSDLKDVFYDVFFRANYEAGKDSLYMDAVNKGLLMPFMTTQARITGKGYKLPGTWSKLQDIAAYHGESMEMWTRMAIANRVIKRQAQKQGISFDEARKIPAVMEEATAMARDYLDFSRGGWLTKMIDQLGAIYLNAGVQVGRKYYQAMKEDPVGTTAAIIQGIGVPTVGITLASALLAKKTYKEIPSYQDENNLNIPLSDNFRFKDSMGNERGLYISLPIGSHAGMMKNIFKEATQYYLFKAGLSDKEPDMKTISGSMKGSLPNPNMMPPSIQAISEALMNKDFRTGQDITPKTFSYPRMGTGEVQLGKTPQMAVDFGKATGLSPDRSAKFVDTLIGNNEWTALVGVGYDKLYSDLPKDVREESFALMISKVPGFKRVFKSTISGGERTDVQKEIKEESEFPRWVERMTLQYYSKVANWQGSNEAKDKVREMLRNKEVLADPDRFDRLFNLNEFVRSIEKLPDRNSWLSMWHESAEAKAKDYLDRERRAKTPEEQTQLRKEFAIVCSTGGYDSGAFWESYGKLRSQGWKVH